MLVYAPIHAWRAVIPHPLPPHHRHHQLHVHPHPPHPGFQLQPQAAYIPQFLDRSHPDHQEVRGPRSAVSQTRETVRWERPHAGWIKINSDASVRSQTAASGGLGRDHNGDILFALSHPLPKARTAVEAEAEALLMCLSHAVERGYTRIWMESDSKLVVDAVNHWPQMPFFNNNHQIIGEIRRILATSVERWTCSHIYREGNAAADYLSKLGHDGGARTWDDPQRIPNQLYILACRDLCGRQ